MSGVVMDGDWLEKVLGVWVSFANGRLGPAITEDAKRNAPVGPGSPGPPVRVGGELRDSIENHMTGTTLIVAANAPYAAYVELGTRPHIIRPHERTRGGWTGPYTGLPGVGQHSLHWVGAGGDVFAWLVHHPGTRPEPYLRPALYQARTDLL